MSEQIKNGGPAFPVDTRGTSDTEDAGTYGHQTSASTWQFPGMTLRDYCAAKAMHAELITCGIPGEACDALIAAASKAGRTPEQQVAWNAYRMADAMLAAREAKS